MVQFVFGRLKLVAVLKFGMLEVMSVILPGILHLIDLLLLLLCKQFSVLAYFLSVSFIYSCHSFYLVQRT